jgi:hypothetical protein
MGIEEEDLEEESQSGCHRVQRKHGEMGSFAKIMAWPSIKPLNRT